MKTKEQIEKRIKDLCESKKKLCILKNKELVHDLNLSINMLKWVLQED